MGENNEPAITGKGMRPAIIADDEDGVRNMLARMIEFIIPEIKVEAVTNGRDLAERVIKGNYAFAVTDNSMTGGNGLEAIAEIRKYNQDIPICMTSGDTNHGIKSIEERAREAGANDFLPKPYTLEDLERIVKKYCEMRK